MTKKFTAGISHACLEALKTHGEMSVDAITAVVPFNRHQVQAAVAYQVAQGRIKRVTGRPYTSYQTFVFVQGSRPLSMVRRDVPTTTRPALVGRGGPDEGTAFHQLSDLQQKLMEVYSAIDEITDDLTDILDVHATLLDADTHNVERLLSMSVGELLKLEK